MKRDKCSYPKTTSGLPLDVGMFIRISPTPILTPHFYCLTRINLNNCPNNNNNN